MKKNKKNNYNSSINDGKREPALVVTNDVLYFTREQYEIRLRAIHDFLVHYPLVSILSHISTFCFSYGITKILNWLSEKNKTGYVSSNFFVDNKLSLLMLSASIVSWIISFVLWKKFRGFNSLKKKFLNDDSYQHFESTICFDLSSNLTTK